MKDGRAFFLLTIRLPNLVLDDDHDHIRYALLCVLIKLTERNPELQQFMAFNEGFERLFVIMQREGMKEVAPCSYIARLQSNGT